MLSGVPRAKDGPFGVCAQLQNRRPDVDAGQDLDLELGTTPKIPQR